MNNCIFCESEFADLIQPHNREKICVLFDVTFNGKKVLHDGKICTRCRVQVELIDNAARLKTEMNQCLQDKLAKQEERLSSNITANNGTNSKPSPQLKQEKANSPVAQGPAMPQPLPQPQVFSPPPPPMLAGVPSPAEMMAMATMQAAFGGAPLLSLPQPDLQNAAAQSAAAVAAASAMQSVMKGVGKEGVFMCVHCGKACADHTELVAHDAVCLNNRINNETTPMNCDRCGQSLKHRTADDRLKHIVQCKGQGMRRGRPSTGIVNCPKCNLSLKNRMNHDRINHVTRCTGSGLKRGRPSMKTEQKYQCNKCNRNLWSKEQLELHQAKCDGSHVERRGRKPGDNSCMVCGENLIYRHILKKHLRQAHGINPQNLDDSVIAAVKNEHSIEELSTPYKKILLNQIQQHLTTTLPPSLSPAQFPLTHESDSPEAMDKSNGTMSEGGSPVAPNADSEDSLGQSFDSTLSHRKQAKPFRYMAENGREAAVSYDRGAEMFQSEVPYEAETCDRDTAASSPLDAAADEELDMDEEPVDDVISAISARAATAAPTNAHQTTAAAKGSALAQVISGLLGANKAGNSSPAPYSNPPHMQSIST